MSVVSIDDELMELLEVAVCDGDFECKDCGLYLEPDADKCPECGWKNPLREWGLI